MSEGGILNQITRAHLGLACWYLFIQFSFSHKMKDSLFSSIKMVLMFILVYSISFRYKFEECIKYAIISSKWKSWLIVLVELTTKRGLVIGVYALEENKEDDIELFYRTSQKEYHTLNKSLSSECTKFKQGVEAPFMICFR